MTQKRQNQWGFTLVEMIVSVGIVVIILLGMSNFFSGILRSTLVSQKLANEVQGQFVVNEILRNKLQNVTGLIGSDTDSAVVINELSEGGLPFTYMAQNGDRIAFRDFLIFNGLTGNSMSLEANVDNPGGVAYIGLNYYITAPMEDKIYRCTPAPLATAPCSELTINNITLNQPIDIEASTDALGMPDGETLFISSAGSDEIIVVDVSTQNGTMLNVTDLNFPTGLAYYQDGGGTNYLFVSDTGNNQVKRIELDDPPENDPVEIVVTLGAGDNEDCDGSASYCKPNFPTGLHVDDDNLYIADSGNNRILKVSEPSMQVGTGGDYTFAFTLADHYRLDKITLENANMSTGPYSPQDGLELPDGSNLIGQGVDYDNTSMTFTSPTSASQPVLYEFDDCDIVAGFFYLASLPAGQELRADDKFIVEYANDAFATRTVDSLLANFDCDSGPGSDPRYQITSPEDDSDVSGGTIDGGDPFFFANPLNAQMKIQNVNFSAGGFQPVEIRTFEVGDATEKELDTVVVRVGDGVLGSVEDMVTVLVSGLNFPTGISTTVPSLTVADSLNGQLRTYNKDTGLANGGSTPFTAFDGADFSSFDYVSDFTVQSVGFATLNGGKLLEMTLEADISDSETKTYTLNASLP